MSKTDKIVFKGVNKNWSDSTGNSWAAPFRDSIYTKGRTKDARSFSGDYWDGKVFKTVRFKNKLPKHVFRVNAGLHAFCSPTVLKQRAVGTRFLKCVIPAGTPYIYGTRGEIVTLKLKVIGQVGRRF